MLQNNPKLIMAYNHKHFSVLALEVCYALTDQDWAQVDSSSRTQYKFSPMLLHPA